LYLLGVATGPTIVDPSTVVISPTSILKLLCNCPSALEPFRVASREPHQDADPPHAARLLRPRRERPCSRTADKRNELASPHWPFPQAKDNTLPTLCVTVNFAADWQLWVISVDQR
jgi:hypothetical protein